MRKDDRELALALERALTRKTLEQHTAEGVDVGTAVDRAAFDLFGCNVVDRPDEAAVARQAANRRHVPCKAEVADIDPLTVRLCGDENVAGLYVPVHQPRGVCRIDGLGDLADKFESAFRLERTFAAKELTEVRPFHVGHCQIEKAVLLAGSDNRDDVRMVEACCQTGLAEKPLAIAVVVCQLRCENLERDPVTARRVLGEVHLARRAFADEGVDAKTDEDGAGSYVRPHR